MTALDCFWWKHWNWERGVSGVPWSSFIFLGLQLEGKRKATQFNCKGISGRWKKEGQWIWASEVHVLWEENSGFGWARSNWFKVNISRDQRGLKSKWEKARANGEQWYGGNTERFKWETGGRRINWDWWRKELKWDNTWYCKRSWSWCVRKEE